MIPQRPLFFLTLLLTPTLISATCTAFRQTSPAYRFDPTNQSQTVSPALTCTTNSTTYGNCVTPSPNSTTSANSTVSCVLYGAGTFTATGTTNLSLPLSDTEYLFPLVNATADFSAVFVVGTGFNASVTGCVDQQSALTCLDVGRSAYMQVRPQLLCVNSTLSGCGAGGPIADGTGIAICGVRSLVQTRDGLVSVTPAWGIMNVYVDADEVAGLAVNPAANATCMAFYASAGGRARGWGRWLACRWR